MEFLVLVLVSLIGSSIESHLEKCDIAKCYDLSPVGDLRPIRYTPNKEQLDLLCPRAVQYANCIFDEIKNCSGKTLEELETSLDIRDSITATMLLSAGSYALDLCNEKSQLHKDYTENINCYLDFVEDMDKSKCQEDAEMRVKAFFDSNPLSGEENDRDTVIAGQRCLVKAYRQACVSLQLEEHCGEVARKTYLFIIGRVKPWLGQECYIKKASILKNRFVNYLGLEEPTKNKYKFAFHTV
ncbi:uncharacterized protein TNCT_633001 [Trichonephila clavata]|uniref:Uncharacterized protein n=1 Tax=Trichonephila clavata TaxID=2740835 RepID=A0A8X6LW14_TRICU|nr:uncharacterized protein TNCT_633001 [Trichonephila clavata]